MEQAVERSRREALEVVAARRELVRMLVDPDASSPKMQLLCTTYRSVVMALDDKTVLKFMRVAGVSDTDPLEVLDGPDTDAFKLSVTVARYVTSGAFIGTRILPSDHVPLLPITEEIRSAAVDAAAVPMRRFATTLAAEFAARRWFTNDELVRLANRLRHAVSTAHRQHHQHGDLHPGQVLMDRDPSTAVITDWLPVYATDPIPAPRGPYDPPTAPIRGMDADRWALGCLLVDAMSGCVGTVCVDLDDDAIVTPAERARIIGRRVWSNAGEDDAKWLATVLRGVVCSEGIAERAPCEVVGMARKLLRKEACPRGLCDIYDNKDE